MIKTVSARSDSERRSIGPAEFSRRAAAAKGHRHNSDLVSLVVNDGGSPCTSNATANHWQNLPSSAGTWQFDAEPHSAESRASLEAHVSVSLA
ncbi:MAG: hypothetical protein ACKPKO_34150, partial [Candidatus Fonsibacter sp.]